VLRLYDTAKGEVAVLEPRREGELSIYLCGPTVSGDYHAGHGRFTLTWDVLRRYLIWSGLSVRFVSNVTDIEDKIIARSRAEGRSAEGVAAHYEAEWWRAMARLGVMVPSETPHATAYVADMVALIADLVERGHAYQAGDGVYLEVETIPGYGLLARQPLESLRSGARVEVADDVGKRSPLDFVLWKAARPDEPGWDAPWGAGRPGWHTECVVMSLGLLGDGFDLHGGGLDLAFPHHENERAQAVGTGREFARRWAHSGLVVVDSGEKMSKSEGNGVLLDELLATYDPRALRLRVVQAHYRSPMSFSPDTLAAATRTLEGLDGFAREFADARGGAGDPVRRERFQARMDDDLDTPAASALLFDWARDARAATGSQRSAIAATVLDAWEQALGLPLGMAGREVPDAVRARAAARDEARRSRDFATADRIRDELIAEGWIVEDTADGTVIR
jgi:cysteinyl-tRNA synthetase